MPPRDKVHYRRDAVYAACQLPRPPVPAERLTDNLLAVTCVSCQRSLYYRGHVTAAAQTARHALAGQAVLNPEFLPGRGMP